MKSHHKKKKVSPKILTSISEKVVSDFSSVDDSIVQNEPVPEPWVVMRGWQFHISQVVFLSIIILSILSYLLISNY